MSDDPTLGGGRAAAVWQLDPATYQAHSLHRGERAWPETNCYVDLWIELLHAAGVEPVAAMAFTLAADFEGDQWTFYKFPLGDIARLFGIYTEELSIWKPPVLHALEQVRRGRIPLMEVDSYYLPDTAGTSYQREHTKTTIGIQHVDLERKRMGYFHNAGYYVLEDGDFDGVVRVDDPWTPDNLRLLPYTEFAKLDRLVRRPAAELAAEARELAREHLARRPRMNPFTAYAPRFQADVDWLRGEPLAAFHLYAFASIRQFGSCFELAAVFLRWLAASGQGELEAAAAELDGIAQGAKTLQFKIARAVNAKKPFDAAAALDDAARRWDKAMSELDGRLGAR